MLKFPPFIRTALVPVIVMSLVSIIFLTIYVAGQQNYRQSTNDPQVQMAEDIARALSLGTPITELVPDTTVPVESSLAPFVGIYDKTGTPISGSGKFREGLAKPPIGIFEYAQKHGQHRFTWQPEKGIRIAMVVEKYQTPSGEQGFVGVGRSLREAENRVKQLGTRISIAWLFSACLIALGWFIRQSARGSVHSVE